MSQGRGGAGLTEEPVDGVRSILVREEDLERDLTPKAGVDGTVDLPHAASADERLERVSLDGLAGQRRGCAGRSRSSHLWMMLRIARRRGIGHGYLRVYQRTAPMWDGMGKPRTERDELSRPRQDAA